MLYALMDKHCSHFPACGGCTLQHFSYEEQLSQKQQIVSTLFAPFGVQPRPILACDFPWRYRNKMEFSFSQNKAGEKFLGLIMHKSRGKVFHLHECLIAPQWFTDVVLAVRQWWEKFPLPAYHFRSGLGTLRNLTVREGRRTGEKMVILTVSGDPRYPLSKEALKGFLESVQGERVSVFLRIQQCIKGRPTQFYEMHLSGPEFIQEELTVLGRRLVFKISPTSFFQPNTLQAEKLYNTAFSLVQLPKEGVVFDLYCGAGALGLSVAPHVRQVVGIELNPYAVFDGQANCELNGLHQVEMICGDVGKVLRERFSKAEVDLVIVDPPRVGLDEIALQTLEEMKARQILYISCNPETQAQNIGRLTSYRLEALQPVDQFPHTPHIENIALLRLC